MRVCARVSVCGRDSGRGFQVAVVTLLGCIVENNYAGSGAVADVQDDATVIFNGTHAGGNIAGACGAVSVEVRVRVRARVCVWLCVARCVRGSLCVAVCEQRKSCTSMPLCRAPAAWLRTGASSRITTQLKTAASCAWHTEPLPSYTTRRSRATLQVALAAWQLWHTVVSPQRRRRC